MALQKLFYHIVSPVKLVMPLKKEEDMSRKL